MMSRVGQDPSSRMWAPDATLRALLDAVPTALAVLDGAGHIAHCNAAWRALGARTAPYGDLGSLVTPSDREGTPYLRRLQGLDGPLGMQARRVARSIQDALAGRPHEERVPYRIRRPEGEEPFEAAIAPLPGGKSGMATVQHVDQGDRERAADAEAAAVDLGLAAEELRLRARRLERSLARVGRELHTPITPVRLELHLLLGGSLGPLTPAQARALSIVARNVQRWADGEQAFLRLPGEGPADPAPLDLAACAREASDARQTQAMQQGVKLAQPAAARPLPVKAPPDVVRDALDRFVDHALASSPSGSTVAVEAHARGREAVVEVRDSGPGLSAREVRAAFEAWGGRRPRPGSSDLSLHHVRLAVEKAGGRVWAESDGPGQGLLLGLAFPLRAPGGI